MTSSFVAIATAGSYGQLASNVTIIQGNYLNLIDVLLVVNAESEHSFQTGDNRRCWVIERRMCNAALIPNPLNSDVEYARFHHLDIPDLEDTELVDELSCLRVFLCGLPPEHWLRKRVKVLQGELTKRRGKK